MNSTLTVEEIKAQIEQLTAQVCGPGLKPPWGGLQGWGELTVHSICCYN
jgi:hypothetical protein